MSSPSAIHQLLRAHETGEYFARLVNHPAPHPLRQAPTLIHHSTVNAVQPQVTVVTPTFNCSAILADYVAATVASASLPFDWILVDDASDDGTPDRARALFEGLRHPLVARATIVRNPIPIYETACDNQGFTLAETDVIIEIQCDIQVREPQYDRLFLRALGSSPVPSAVSGRCGHSYGMRTRKTHWLKRLLMGADRQWVGLCGSLIETPEVIEPLKGHVYRCETVPRGPWAVRKSDLERHGYLDERYFFLGDDDHDYLRRLAEAEGRRPVYVPISIYAPLCLGATRRERTGVNLEVYDLLRETKRGSPAFLAFMASLKAPSTPERIV